jgi:hypothetical protein
MRASVRSVGTRGRILRTGGIHRIGVCFAAAIVAHAVLVCPAFSQATRTQAIQLRQGWNAVFLEVYPTNPEPAAVFAETPVDIAAAFYARGESAQFITQPGAELFKKAGWGVWYAESRPDAFLRTLHAIHGQQTYLVHAKDDYIWNVTGAVVPAEIRWEPSAYNLVGFSIAPQGGPTFAQFFGGSPAHRHNKIYRLTNGAWRRVLAPDAETLQSGEAFWIYCAGPSRYQGPLSVQPPTRQGLLLNAGIASLVLRNTTDHPITPTIEHVPCAGQPVPLSMVVQVVGDDTEPIRSVPAPMPDGAWTQLLPPLEVGGSVQVPFEVRQQDAETAAQISLLKISSDLGTQAWIPVVGLRKDLEESQP